MALIGTMKYLTIGDKTYEIEGEQLSIASASTLGGIKVGSGLSIDSTTGVLSTSITETDPVFTASAAAGITSTDISNWNAKVSDTGKWNDVSLNKTPVSETGKEKVYVPLVTSTSSTTAYLMEATFSNGTKAGSIARYNANSYLISTTPSANDNSTKVATTAYVDGAIGGITVPTKVSDLTNDSGFITSYTETDPVYSASAASGITSSDISNWNGKSSTDNKVLQQLSTSNNSFCVLLRQNTGTTFSTDGTLFSANFTVQPSTGNITVGKVNNYTLAAACAKSVDASITASSSSTNLPTSAAVASFVEGKGYITGYTETDPVFSASAAAGITSTDISNWNAKVSDDKTWNGVTLNKSSGSSTSTIYVPYATGTSATSMNYATVSASPTQYALVKYDASSYLYSTTPSANDNSTKVATTAYVDAAIPKVYSSTNTSGYLTMATLPIYDGTVE